MAKQYTVDILSVKSIERLKKELIKYRDSLKAKSKLLVEKLVEVGLDVIDVKLSESPLGHHVTVQVHNEGDAMVIVAEGEIKTSDDYPPFNTLLAIEFGAGIRYNPTENPKADDLGYGVGTFPGQTHAFQEEGWYFLDKETGKWIHSFGVKATMPMYEATVEMREQVEKIAKEVFDNA